MKMDVMKSKRSVEAMHHLKGGNPKILPSLLQCDFGNLRSEIEQLERNGVPALHLDVMDGHFVPNFTYGMTIVDAVRKLTELSLDVHLMMSEPGKYIQAFVDAGADCLTIHAEIAGDVGAVLQQIRNAGVAVGLALNPATSLAQVGELLPSCDLLLMMSVNAGFGGQSFNAVALEKLRAVKVSHPGLILEIDGGVNRETIAGCVEAGAELLVVGSAIFGQDDYGQALKQLADAIGR